MAPSLNSLEITVLLVGVAMLLSTVVLPHLLTAPTQPLLLNAAQIFLSTAVIYLASRQWGRLYERVMPHSRSAAHFCQVLLLVVQSVWQLICLVHLIGKWGWWFVLPDVLVLLGIVSSLPHPWMWGWVYVVSQIGKKMAGWKGQDGFYSSLLNDSYCFTIPITLLRVLGGGPNRCVVKWLGIAAYCFHFYDTTQLLEDSRDKLIRQQYLEGALFGLFALMGYTTTHVYFFYLFTPTTKSTTTTSSGPQPTTLTENADSDNHNSSEDSPMSSTNLECYLLWNMLFIDLPFMALRGAESIALHAPLNLLIGKNLSFIGITFVLFL